MVSLIGIMLFSNMHDIIKSIGIKSIKNGNRIDNQIKAFCQLALVDVAIIVSRQGHTGHRAVVTSVTQCITCTSQVSRWLHINYRVTERAVEHTVINRGLWRPAKATDRSILLLGVDILGRNELCSCQETRHKLVFCVETEVIYIYSLCVTKHYPMIKNTAGINTKHTQH